ncbi:uncharacterized protein AB675_11007 [Cyphellophora attinorum]|uniref:Uncharacterized protein n=1 Tax=Cyphellophora attinorum TaxID=1664694 RepID=A0A0N0NIJ7_9EURO|nr:uncharacterized protein AB675_11007 [Phialophora attinorum]KPI35519.1 hypothetical protein AB675_11007 [Phialophora attinorum]
MKTSSILRRAADKVKIFFVHSTHHSKDGRRSEAIGDVEEFIKGRKLEGRGVAQAAIRSSYHKSPEDRREHLTVDFLDKDGNFITTRHVCSSDDEK